VASWHARAGDAYLALELDLLLILQLCQVCTVEASREACCLHCMARTTSLAESSLFMLVRDDPYDGRIHILPVLYEHE
jgi:hypothetical protein